MDEVVKYVLFNTLPSVIVAIMAIIVIGHIRSKGLERERQEQYKIVSAEIQFNDVYADIYATRVQNLDDEVDYTPFVIRADTPIIKDNMSLERYWELVEMNIEKTEEELRNELYVQNSQPHIRS